MLLELDGVSKRFVTQGRIAEVLSRIDLRVERGEFVSLIGPSGSGKSTILNLLAGLDRPSGGHARYDGREVDGISRSVAYLTQHDSLLPWRTVEDNVGLPLELRSVGRSARSKAVREILEKVGLAGYERHHPRQLSGGMQKRAMLARTLVYDPEIILMDEPFGPLDAQLKLVLQDELMQLWAGSGKTIVFVTHDIVEAITLSDRVVVLSRQPTRVKHIEDITIARPRTVRDIRFAPSFERHYKALWDAIEIFQPAEHAP